MLFSILLGIRTSEEPQRKKLFKPKKKKKKTLLGNCFFENSSKFNFTRLVELR